MALTKLERAQLLTALLEDVPEKLRSDPEIVTDKFLDVIELEGPARRTELVRLLAQKRDRFQQQHDEVDEDATKRKTALLAGIAELQALIDKLAPPTP